MNTSSRTLSQIPVGTSVRIDRYLSSDPALRRFREMGLLPGTIIRVVRLAPMGDPMEISVGASLLSLRREQAALITVTAEPTDGK
ncbi:MAG: ferrous iron transport protein A [Verrucomicrobiae bacterium]|nr:ferrous iron transport protein A [Verrucomicrobiae bacterium]